jgi:RNA polymerase sigma-70 factor, ECF subfamily
MDDVVVQRARLGDEDAFDQLVEAYTPLVWRTAMVLLGNRLLAEDAMQEAWLDIWRALPAFRADIAAFRSWLLAIVANRCRKMVRRRVLPTLSLEREDLTLADDLISAYDTETQALRNVTDAEVHAALATLSNDQRAILELYAFADLTLAEIALVTDTALGTVKSRFHRALQALRARLRAGEIITSSAEGQS